MPLAQVVKYHDHGKVYYCYHYGDTFNFTNEIPEEEQCFYDYYCICTKDICPHYRECDYSVKEVK